VNIFEIVMIAVVGALGVVWTAAVVAIVAC
jgi:hypothetical protein